MDRNNNLELLDIEQLHRDHIANKKKPVKTEKQQQDEKHQRLVDEEIDRVGLTNLLKGNQAPSGKRITTDPKKLKLMDEVDGLVYYS
ncbi:hypothetical protein [Thalassotalea sp. Y01]|uniref:hypothetical protein n=1 Tax=Thalassotalea sp. Y01 TaxID=2729613 RepID=UPI00145C99BC|nr:hypothetical protein [Thalassotalea sp. Y01]NMP16134.1 hypothetical protein [Thalassotalea sp. Y01]